MGNHDNDPYGTSDFAAETPYREELGPADYPMNIGKVHFLMLDNTVYLNNGGGPGVIGDRTYNKYFTQQQLDWIREDLVIRGQIDSHRRRLPLPDLHLRVERHLAHDEYLHGQFGGRLGPARLFRRLHLG